MTRRLISAVLLAVAAIIGGCSDERAANLPAFEAKRDATSVSGISSGAYMAGQFEMAHAKDVVGIGIIAGGPYGCSESLYADVIPGPGTALLNLTKAINGCMQNALQAFGVPDPAQLAHRAERLAEHDRIDPIADVKSDRIYLFTGTNDHTVVRPIVAAARRFYEDLGVPAAQILYVDKVPAGHAFVTDERGPECDHTGKPYIVDCDYDQAGALLKQIYGPLNEPSKQTTGRFKVFDQESFTEDLSNHGLSDDGIVYVPEACEANAGCRVHIAFHGCGQNRTVRRRRLRARFGLCALGRHQQPDRAVSANGDDAAQSARLLGLVGIHGRELPDARRPTDRRRVPHAGTALGATKPLLT